MSLMFSSAAQGAVVTVNISSNAYHVSSSDLLQAPGVITDDALLSINVPESGGYVVSSLTDGLCPDEDRSLAVADGTLTYYLDTAVHSNGYDLSRIETCGGWANGGRSRQQYSVLFATVSDPSNFVSLVGHIDSGQQGASYRIFTSVSITNNTDAPLATGVSAIRFVFPPQLNGGAGYRELDLFGTPTAPPTATKVAGTIFSITTPMRGSTRLALPEVPSGFNVTIKSSSHPDVVAVDGTINPPATDRVVQLVLTVTDTAAGETADTQLIHLFVPAASVPKPFVSYADNFSMCRGLFIHWSAPPDGYNNPIVFSDGSRSATIDQFTKNIDVPAVVNEIVSLGFEYVIITDFHGYQTVLHPCAAIDSWRTVGCTSTRDLIGEMIAALKAEGIPVYLFTHPLDGKNCWSAEEQERVGWFDATGNYQRWNNYVNDVYAELTERYGDDIAGFGFDSEFGMISSDTFGKLDLPRLRETILSRRPHLSLHGLAGPNDTVELGMKEIWRPTWLDPWNSRSEHDTDVDTWPGYRRFVAMVQGYHWTTITAPEGGMARLTGEKMFRYSVLQAALSTEGPGMCWAATPYADGSWENHVREEFVVLETLTQPVRESLRGVLPSTSYPREEGVWIRDLPQGVAATRSLDDSVEYIHVLNPPAGSTLTLPLPEDGKQFTSATLLGNGNTVQMVTNAVEVGLTLGGGDTWDANHTVIKLRVDPESRPQRNLALHKSVSASSSVQFGLSWGTTTPWGLIRLVDGQVDAITPTNGWSAGHFGYSSIPSETNGNEWICVDLDAVCRVGGVRMHPRSDAGHVGYGYPVDFRISTSLDGTNWMPVVERNDQPRPSSAQEFYFPVQVARYVRMDAGQLRANPNEGGQYAFQLAELDVLGVPALMWKIPDSGSLVLEWDEGALQSADNLDEPFADMPAAESPYTVDCSTNAPRKFFRVRY